VLITMALVLASWQAQAKEDSQLLADDAESQCATMRMALGLSGAACQAVGFAQETMAGDIAHFTFSLQVGSGAHDVIRLHRVVRESNGILLPTNKTIFMVHGDVWDFTAAFLGGTLSDADGVPDAQSIAVFLAANNVDVWGIDMRWTQVPPDTTDFTFMADWGLLRLASDVGIGLATARNIRTLTGAGVGKLHLLGWSGGGFIAWVYANLETQLPSGLRHMKGLIPVDIYFKLAPAAENQRQDACTRQDTLQELFDSGMFHNDTGNLVATVGQLALTDPNGASAIIPGLTNAQAGLLVGTSTFVLAAPPPVPFYHFTVGAFGPMGLPTGLRFTDEAFFWRSWRPASSSSPNGSSSKGR
jgi:pimeloyl-ACP methyl ester carboxylesterase